MMCRVDWPVVDFFLPLMFLVVLPSFLRDVVQCSRYEELEFRQKQPEGAGTFLNISQVTYSHILWGVEKAGCQLAENSMGSRCM